MNKRNGHLLSMIGDKNDTAPLWKYIQTDWDQITELPAICFHLVHDLSLYMRESVHVIWKLDKNMYFFHNWKRIKMKSIKKNTYNNVCWTEKRTVTNKKLIYGAQKCVLIAKRPEILCSFCTGFYLEFNQFRFMALFCLFFLIDTFTLFWFARRTRIAVQLTASYEKPEHIYVYCNCHLTQLKRTMPTWHSSMHFYANPVFISSLHQWWYHHRKSWHFVFNWIFVFQDFQNRSVWKSFAQKKITRKKIRRENFVENLISLCMLLRMFTC